MGASGYLCTTLTVFFYEFFGTFTLVAAVNGSKGNATAVGLTLFFLLLLTGPITGGHMNPSVTIGVYLNRVRKSFEDDTFGSITFQALVMIVAQITGALFSMYLFFELIKHTDADGKIAEADFPHLAIHTDNWTQAMLFEAFCTFVFISAILLVKDAESGRFVTQINGEGINFFGCGLIALSLVGMILVCGPHSGASLNPAVSISQTTLDVDFLKVRASSDDFWRVYMLGPIIGATVSGLCSWGHAAALRDHAPLAPVEDEVKPLIQKDEENAAKED